MGHPKHLNRVGTAAYKGKKVYLFESKNTGKLYAYSLHAPLGRYAPAEGLELSNVERK